MCARKPTCRRPRASLRNLLTAPPKPKCRTCKPLFSVTKILQRRRSKRLPSVRGQSKAKSPGLGFIARRIRATRSLASNSTRTTRKNARATSSLGDKPLPSRNSNAPNLPQQLRLQQQARLPQVVRTGSPMLIAAANTIRRRLATLRRISRALPPSKPKRKGIPAEIPPGWGCQ